jgi:hypothetical protein
MSEAAAAPPPALSPVERVVDTLIDPARTFEDLRRDRSWWLPFALLVLVGWIFCFVAARHVGMSTLAANVLHSQPRSAAQMEKATPEQAERMIAVTSAIIKGFFFALPLTLLVAEALLALLLWAGVSFVLGGRTTYREMLAVAMYAALPGLLGSVLSLVTVMVADPQGYNINLPSPAVLGYFVSPEAPHWLVTLAGSINLFTLWSLALAGLGAGILARVRPARAVLLVLAAWALFVLLKTGIAAA